MRRMLLALTDSETPLGNAVLCGLALAAVLAWSGCQTDPAGLGGVGVGDADAAVGTMLSPPGDSAEAHVVVAADAGVPEARLADIAPPDARALSLDTHVLPVDVQPVPAPDVLPADTAPAGAYGTPYPACTVAVALAARDCPGGTGSCRTLDGLVCMVCDVPSPCAFWTERYGGDPPARTAGPACDRGRVCMSSCPITRGPTCERPMGSNGGQR
jgi:hypothetical protein